MLFERSFTSSLETTCNSGMQTCCTTLLFWFNILPIMQILFTTYKTVKGASIYDVRAEGGGGLAQKKM